MCSALAHVRLVPKADSYSAAISMIIRSARRRAAEDPKHVEAERLGGPEIYNQLEFGRSHDRKVSRFLAFENPPGIDARSAKGIRMSFP